MSERISFFKKHIGATGPEASDAESLKLEIEQMKEHIEKLQAENEQLREKVMNRFNIWMCMQA